MAPLRRFTYPFSVNETYGIDTDMHRSPDANYLNGVVMNWLYLLLVLALAGYLLRALARLMSEEPDMWQEIIYPVAFVLLVLLPAPLLGNYLYRVFEGKSRWLAPLERATLACCGTDGREQDWKSYALSLLAFNGAGFGLLFLILMAQGLLPSTRSNCRAELATRLQHRGQLHDQHQLAGLLRRSQPLLLQPDGGAHHPELRLRRHRRPPSPSPCFAASPASRPPTLATSGRIWCVSVSTCCCRWR